MACHLPAFGTIELIPANVMSGQKHLSVQSRSGRASKAGAEVERQAARCGMTGTMVPFANS